MKTWLEKQKSFIHSYCSTGLFFIFFFFVQAYSRPITALTTSLPDLYENIGSI